MRVTAITRHSVAIPKREDDVLNKIKTIGVRLCVLGSAGAILFPPTRAYDVWTGWWFIFSDRQIINFIDPITLLLELILINGIGMVLYLIGTTQQKK